MPDRRVWFGTGLGAWNGADVASAADTVRLVEQADRDGLDPAATAAPPVRLGRAEIARRHRAAGRRLGSADGR
jgi:hypothetical protein